MRRTRRYVGFVLMELKPISALRRRMSDFVGMQEARVRKGDVRNHTLLIDRSHSDLYRTGGMVLEGRSTLAKRMPRPRCESSR
jgi:hypothetical protein